MNKSTKKWALLLIWTNQMKTLTNFNHNILIMLAQIKKIYLLQIFKMKKKLHLTMMIKASIYNS